MRLIDADAIKDPYEGTSQEGGWVSKLLYLAVSEQPTVDPVKHGHWIFSPSHSEGICTRCNSKIYGRPYNNTYVIMPYKYCPHCGALMDEGGDAE